MAKTPIYSSDNPDKDLSKQEVSKSEKPVKAGKAKETPKETEKKKPAAKKKKAETKQIQEQVPHETETDTDEIEKKPPAKWKKPVIAILSTAAGIAAGIFIAMYTWENFVDNVKQVETSEAAEVERKFSASTWFSDYNAMKKTVTLYDNIHPFIYSLRGGRSNDGRLISIWGKTQTIERMKELRELNPKVKIIPTIFRWENKGEQISEAIGMNGRNDIRDKHIQIILSEIETYGYDGIDIDYEGMDCSKKEKFEEFIVLLSAELKKRKKLLSVAVHPKTPISRKRVYQKKCAGLSKPVTVDFKENWRGPMTHDYEFLARYADMFKIMAYELHPRKYYNPGPGPQAPTYWLKDIIKYARRKVPAEKLYMAIPTYGYDWALNCRSSIRAVYFDDAKRIMQYATMHQPTNMDEIYKENANGWTNLSKFMYIHKGLQYDDPSLWYKQGGCDRVAFFMNRKAFEAKMTVLRGFDLAGFSFWQLMSTNDPEINAYLKLLMNGKLPDVPRLDHELLDGIQDHSEPVGVLQLVKSAEPVPDKAGQ